METTPKKDKRKLLIFLPLIVVPLLALAFYLFGGGKDKEKTSSENATGINTELPDASFNADTPKTKTDYYDRAERNATKEDSNAVIGIAERLGFDGGTGTGGKTSEQTKAIDEKLTAIQREINRPEPAVSKRSGVEKQSSSGIKGDVDRLEAMMKTMQGNRSEDPEMAQLNQMMQNILDIQHPERLTRRGRFEASFYPDSQFRATSAIISASGKVVQGATVRLKLKDSLLTGGVVIPKGHELFGACRIANQRLLIDIKNIRLGTSIIPVDLSVYSLDGMVGIAAPEAVLTDVLNNGTDNAVRGIGIGGFDQSLGMQVASAGIDAARQMISRRVRKIKVKLQAGQPVLIRDNKRTR